MNKLTDELLLIKFTRDDEMGMPRGEVESSQQWSDAQLQGATIFEEYLDAFFKGSQQRNRPYFWVGFLYVEVKGGITHCWKVGHNYLIIES